MRKIKPLRLQDFAEERFALFIDKYVSPILQALHSE
jgi:hypothetical protein